MYNLISLPQYLTNTTWNMVNDIHQVDHRDECVSGVRDEMQNNRWVMKARIEQVLEINLHAFTLTVHYVQPKQDRVLSR